MICWLLSALKDRDLFAFSSLASFKSCQKRIPNMIRLVFVDFSGTLVAGSGANSGADFLGKGGVYRQIYPKYKLGKLKMDELLTRTYACWEGLKLSDLPKVYGRFEFNDGVKETLWELKRRGIRTALLSQIPTHLGALFKEELRFDFVTGTVLEVKKGAFTGKILEFHDNKAKEAKRILDSAKVSPQEAVSIGDRKDDAEVFKILKFGVAYNGDEAARNASKYQITDFRGLINILEKQ